MSFIPKPPHLIGIELGARTLKIAALKKMRKGWDVIHLKEVPLSEAPGALSSVSKQGVISTALRARHVLVRPFFIQLKRERDISTALEFQAESLFPYPPQKAVVTSSVIEKKSDGTQLIVSAALKEHVQTHLEEVQALSIEPEHVTSLYHALAASASLFQSGVSPQLLVYIGEREVACALVQEGKLLKGHSFDLSKDFEAEMKKVILSLSDEAFDGITLLGSQEPSYREALQKVSGKNVSYPSTAALHLSEERLVRFGGAIGMALCGEHASFLSQSKVTNFRKKEFAYPFPFRRLRRPLTLFFTLSLLLTGSLFALSSLSLKGNAHRANLSYQTLLANTGEEPVTLSSPQSYEKALERLKKKIEQRPDTFPLHPSYPRAHEVLAFLTTLPGSEALSLTSFHYHLAKRPTFAHPKERYRPKVELELSTSNAQQARKFLEALQKENPFVDPKAECKWEQSGALFRAQFSLKDKTRYH